MIVNHGVHDGGGGSRPSVDAVPDQLGERQGRGNERIMRTKNIGNIERAARIVGGLLLAVLGLTLLIATGGPPWLFAIDAVLIALGLDFAVTGVTGHCLIYQWLGWSTAPEAKASVDGR